MSRRRFLVLIAALLSAPAVSGSRVSAGRSRSGQPQGLEVVVADIEAAARLGRQYLAGLAVVPTAGQLADEITQTLASFPDDPAVANDGALVDRARQAVSEDYLQARVADVGGWVLSVTEARLFALAALGAWSAE